MDGYLGRISAATRIYETKDMNSTPFSTKPIEVVALTVQEFMSDLDMDGSPALDVICRRFDAERFRSAVDGHGCREAHASMR